VSISFIWGDFSSDSLFKRFVIKGMDDFLYLSVLIFLHLNDLGLFHFFILCVVLFLSKRFLSFSDFNFFFANLRQSLSLLLSSVSMFKAFNPFS
jgi:hypothetical protein